MAAAAAAGAPREGFDWTRASFADAAARVAGSALDDRDGIEDGPANIPLPGIGGRMQLPGLGGSLDRIRKVPLTVRDDDLGAGLEISFVPKCGFVVEAVAEVPGQPGLREGDIIVNIGGQSLALETEEEADEVLASQLLDGVELTVTQDPMAALDPLAALPGTALTEGGHGDATGQTSESASVPTTSLAAATGSTPLPAPNSSSLFDFDELEDSADAAALPVTSLAGAPGEASTATLAAESGLELAEEEHPVDAVASPASGGFETMSVAELRKELAERGLSAEGCLEKSDLVKRIVSATAAAGDTSEAAETSRQEADRAVEAGAAGEAPDDVSSASEKTMPLQRWLEADPESNRPDVGVAEEALSGCAVQEGMSQARQTASESALAPQLEQARDVAEESDDVVLVSPDVLKSTLSNTLLKLSSTLGAAGLPASDELPANRADDDEAALDGEVQEGKVQSFEVAEEDSKAECGAWSHAPTSQAAEEDGMADAESWSQEAPEELGDGAWSQERPSSLPLPRTLVGARAASASPVAPLAAASVSSSLASPLASAARSKLGQKAGAAPSVESTDDRLALVPVKESTGVNAVSSRASKSSGTRSSAPAAVQFAAPAPEGAENAGTVRCKVQDLWDWMVEMSIQEYFERATEWCIEMGAATLEEIAENIEDFGDDVNLKPIEKQRVQKWAAQVLMRSGGGVNGINSWVIETECPRGSGSSSAWSLEAADVPRGGSANGWGGTANGWGNSASSWGSVSGWGFEGEADADMEMVGDSSLESGANYTYQNAAESPSSQGSSVHIYTARSIRLAMDSRGGTGLGLEWDEEWGIRVRSVDPLPGQPGLRVGDYIVAIDGCSLRHRPHEECDSVFAERLQDGACLSVVSLQDQDVSPQWQLATRPPTHARHSDSSGRAKGVHVGKSAGPLQMRLSRAPSQVDAQHHWRFGKGRRGPPLSRGGYNPDNMWRRFRGPPW